MTFFICKILSKVVHAIWNLLQIYFYIFVRKSTCNIAWKVSKYSVVSDPYSLTFELNMEIYTEIYGAMAYWLECWIPIPVV